MRTLSTGYALCSQNIEKTKEDLARFEEEMALNKPPFPWKNLLIGMALGILAATVLSYFLLKR